MGAAIAEKSATFDKIRKVAADQFCQIGYKGLGMRDLAAAVGIQVGSLYNHIENKQALLYELISEYELDLLHIFRCKRLSRCDSAVQMNALLWDKVSIYVSRSRNLAQLARSESHYLNSAQALAVSDIRRSRMFQLQLLIAECADDIGLSNQGLEKLCVELHALLDCHINLEADPVTDPNKFVRRQLRNMASMLLVKRD
ncbi:AcrR family transcriptional regulator [Pseudomonas lini]|uniref:TetR/AcrR family transcriptional regulator n=1 Tax=Pseudomonas lini TaxID=163011 RepID=UPI002788695B|nr:helix-turn-helix domain-containing protein [Pseudomonas lini]MDQ0126822.1 AcrR family transcriptional regulator [Pseudomonas lini]